MSRCASYIRNIPAILLKFGGIPDKDMDDFYSLANEVFVEVMKRYDSSQSFEAFLYSCLSKRIKTEMLSKLHIVDGGCRTAALRKFREMNYK